MYKFIIDPSTNLSESILSKKGKNILKKYLRTGLGGEEPVEEGTNALKKHAEPRSSALSPTTLPVPLSSSLTTVVSSPPSVRDRSTACSVLPQLIHKCAQQRQVEYAKALAAKAGKFPCPPSYDCIQKVKLYNELKEQLKSDGMETPKASSKALSDLKGKVAAEVPALLNTELQKIMTTEHFEKYTEYVNSSTDEVALARNLETFYKSLTIDERKKKLHVENIPSFMKYKQKNPNFCFYTLFLKYYYPKSYFESISPKNTLNHLVKCTNTIEECQGKQEAVDEAEVARVKKEAAKKAASEAEAARVNAEAARVNAEAAAKIADEAETAKVRAELEAKAAAKAVTSRINDESSPGGVASQEGCTIC